MLFYVLVWSSVYVVTALCGCMYKCGFVALLLRVNVPLGSLE